MNSEKEEDKTDYELWVASYARASDHLLLSALLREYYDSIDNLIVSYEKETDEPSDFAECMFQFEMDLHNRLEKNDVFDLYMLRQAKNTYINNLRNVLLN